MKVFAPLKALVGRVPIPDVLPGQFFVLEFDREDASYTLHLDDAEHTTFSLGDDVEQIRQVFTSRGYPADRVNELIDRAREFRLCQYIPSGIEHVQDRVVQHLPREARNPTPNPFATPGHGWNNL